MAAGIRSIGLNWVVSAAFAKISANTILLNRTHAKIIRICYKALTCSNVLGGKGDIHPSLSDHSFPEVYRSH